MADQSANPITALFQAFVDAAAWTAREVVTDIRHKLVEEAWFGREVTPDKGTMDTQLGWSLPGSKAEAWDTLFTEAAKAISRQRDIDPNRDREHDQEIDR